MKRTLDSVLERPAKRHKSRYHISDGPLRIIISCLAQPEYATWLCTHQNAKRFKFSGPRVSIYWHIRPSNYDADWWFHRRAATFEFPVIGSAALTGWDSLHLDQAVVKQGFHRLPHCRELWLTQIRGPVCFISSSTTRLRVDDTSWYLLGWLNMVYLEYMEMIDTDPLVVRDMIDHWPTCGSRLEHLVLRFKHQVSGGVNLTIPSVKLCEIYAPKGSNLDTVDSRVRVHYFNLVQNEETLRS